MINKLWKARLGIAQAQYKKGVTMTEGSVCKVVGEVRLSKRNVLDLALRVSSVRSAFLKMMRDAQDAGEIELCRHLSDVWNSIGLGLDSLFDAWTQLAAIEKRLP